MTQRLTERTAVVTGAASGIVLFDEPATLTRIAFLGVIVVGIVGLHLTSGGH